MGHAFVARRSLKRHTPQVLAYIIESLEPRQLFSVGGGFVGAGLLGQYYNNTSMAGLPSFTRTDVRIDGNWNGASPAGSSSPGFSDLTGSDWSAKWTGKIIPRYSETYTFTTESDDGIRVVINGQTVINDWTTHAVTTDKGSITLVAGQAYSIEVDYFQDGGGSEAKLMWSSASTPQEVIEPATPIGINAGTANDYDNSLMFADAVKMSRGWTSVNNPWGANIPTDADGWPTTDAALPLFDADYRAGTYTITFNGSATISTNGSYSGVSVSDQKYDLATNTTTATLTLSTDGAAGAGASALALIFTNTQRTATSATNTGINNVSVMRPTADGASTSSASGTLFTQAYENLLSNFTTIRFMDYLNTNGSTVTTWADRTLPGDVTQSQPTGGSLEYAVELANETGKDLWINVPFGADDDYVTKLADLLKYGSDGVNPYTSVQDNPVFPPLNSGLKVYVEYSNENWNFNPTQANVAAVAAAGVGDPINYDNVYPTNDGGGWTIAQRWVAERSMEISNLFRGVYGDSEMPGTSTDGTVRPLFEWQYGGNWGQVGLDFLNNYYNDADGVQHVSDPHAVSYFFWGGGGAWYADTNNDSASTIDGIFASGLNTSQSVLGDVTLAAEFGLKDVGYEGGFQLGSDSPTALEIQATVDPRAQGMTTATLNAFFAAGGDLPVVYTASGAAHFNYSVAQDNIGATDIFQQDTPKMQAYLAAEQSLPAEVTNGYALPTDPGQTLTIDEGDHFIGSAPSMIASYVLDATSAGTYTVIVQGTTDSSATTEHLTLDGTSLGSTSLPLYSAVTDFGTSSALTFTVNAAGVYGLTVFNDGPTRVHYFGNVTITRSDTVSTPITLPPELPALSNVAVGGTATASGENGTVEGAAQAFDGLNSTKWLTFSGTGYLQYQFADNTAQAVGQYSITTANDDYGRDPESWEVLGSDDGVHWALLDTRTDQTFSGRNVTNTYTIASPEHFNFYRLNITANDGADILQLAEWSLLADPTTATTLTNTDLPTGSLTRLTGGIASASSDGGPTATAAQAFDGDANTKWLAPETTAFLAYQTAQPHVVTQYSITSANDEPGRDPKSWKVIGSNDGIHWTLLDVEKNQTFSTRFETITYSMTNTTAYAYYALKITANNGATCIQLADWSLYTNEVTPSVVTPEIVTGGAASASSQNSPNEGASMAFDQDSTTKWLAFDSSGWLQYTAPQGAAYVISQYAITSANDDYGRDPEDWEMLASNDGINWTTLDVQAGQSFSGRLTTNTYAIDNSTAYRYYRLEVTANDGGGDLQLGGLDLYGTTVST